MSANSTTIDQEKSLTSLFPEPETLQRAISPLGNISDCSVPQIQRGLKPRHAQIIAIGGAVGTSLFVGTGQILAIGGPGFLLLAFCLLCVLIVSIVTALTEVAAYLPVHGGTMSYYASNSLGFSLGYLYWYSLGILIPYEITAASLVMEYWETNVPISALIIIMIALVVVLNLLPVSVYGDVEFWFISLKVFLIIGLLITSVILFFGGGPDHDTLGFRYWKNPGAVNEYLKQILPEDSSHGAKDEEQYKMVEIALCSFREGFTRLLYLARGDYELFGGKHKGKRGPDQGLKESPLAWYARQTTLALTNGGAGAGSSPFVVGITNAGIPVLDTIVNVGILDSAWSAGNAFLYAFSRSLYSLSVAGNAPSIFTTCNKWGVPYVAVGVSYLFSLLGYLNTSSSSSVVFN